LAVCLHNLLQQATFDLCCCYGCRVYEIDWLSRIIAETDSYVVLDKPAGVSVGGTVDNLEEMCATFVGRALGLKDPLIVTHQIDTCTEGWYVLIFHDQNHRVFYKY
jgi:23S rRNA-/tRNA-specific pseudouridylate synthase